MGVGPATNVVVDDPTVSFTSAPIATLDAGTTADAGSADVVVTATTPSLNTATVTGTDPGNPGGPELTDSDVSTISGPVLEIRKTVVPGPAGTCPATFADALDGDDSIATAVGDTVTYCFWVANTGFSDAVDVAVTDPGLAFTAPTIATLAAGDEALAGSVDEVVSADTPNPNTAEVTLSLIHI